MPNPVLGRVLPRVALADMILASCLDIRAKGKGGVAYSCIVYSGVCWSVISCLQLTKGFDLDDSKRYLQGSLVEITVRYRSFSVSIDY